MSELDRGEAEVLVLAEELKADWLIIDEEKARIAARLIGFRQISTVGVLVLAKKSQAHLGSTEAEEFQVK